MRMIRISLLAFFIALVLAGCAYRYYLGFHGPSVKSQADIHAGITRDKECLECHESQNKAQGPVTSHAQFKGCLKCHNDEVAEKKP